jgi:hypothetical protein
MKRVLLSAIGALLIGLSLVWAQPPVARAWLVQAPASGGAACNTVGVNFTASGTASAAFNFTASTTGGKFNFTCN